MNKDSDEPILGQLIEAGRLFRPGGVGAADLKPGGGGGTSGGMEARIAKLEGQMETVQDSLSDLSSDVKIIGVKVDALTTRFEDFIKRMDTIPADVAKLTTNANHFATRAWVGGSLVVGIGALTGLITLLGKVGALVPTH